MKKKKVIYSMLISFVSLIVCSVITLTEQARLNSATETGNYIKWVDFDICCDALSDTFKIDIETYNADKHISWIDLLACLGSEYGGNFANYKKSDLDKIISNINSGKTMSEITSNMKYYSYYKEAYGAVLDGFVGNFTRDGKKCYGLRVFSPIASGYSYEHYDDFGAARSYGYKREHLGHDMMGSIGTPIIAVESGYVESLGWNQYGGWRIGIRSFDNKRYYYYAHLRKDHPYADIKQGDIVTAGQVIGYLGMTGYSTKENVNNINIPHLHFGIQLIFDISQKDGSNQIWIDTYELIKFLYRNRMTVTKNDDTKEYVSKDPLYIYDIPD